MSEGEESERAEDSIVVEYKAAFLLLFCNTKEAQAQAINHKQTARLKIKAADRRRYTIVYTHLLLTFQYFLGYRGLILPPQMTSLECF